MKFLVNLKEKLQRKTLLDSKEESLRRNGRKQIKKLVDRGIDLPVVLL